VTFVVRTLKFPVVAPAGIVMDAVVGTATAVFVLDSDTTVPPAGAAHSSVAVPLTVPPPVTGFGESVSVFTRIGRTITVCACDTPP
jgi:hypothetical protein